MGAGTRDLEHQQGQRDQEHLVGQERDPLPDEEPPVVGQEMEFNVDRYDEREGVLILTRKGATAQNASWENLEIGQVVEGTVTGVNKGGLEVELLRRQSDR